MKNQITLLVCLLVIFFLSILACENKKNQKEMVSESQIAIVDQLESHLLKFSTPGVMVKPLDFDYSQLKPIETPFAAFRNPEKIVKFYNGKYWIHKSEIQSNIRTFQLFFKNEKYKLSTDEDNSGFISVISFTDVRSKDVFLLTPCIYSIKDMRLFYFFEHISQVSQNGGD